ncbi:unnamed protein product [Spodoptera littoralis]|uniref:Gustatory receptor n=1 Tax=Spodoptera littoralis TaxID=7109 RepID=A0A9P0IGV8_SPOLI|nr:unnamed protein product [Spodoptera littoralis]CAH1645597.1 unnamed protein product [Spodoptera littoralis]
MTLNLTPLKYLLLIENITCVFRNYSLLTRCARILAFAWFFLEVLSILTNAMINFALENEMHIKAQRIYFLTSIGFSLYVMVAAVFYSKKFYGLLLNFDAFYHIFDDRIYNHKLMKAQKIMTITIILFCLIKIVTSTAVRLCNRRSTEIMIKVILYNYNFNFSDFRYLFEYFVLYSILFVICEQLRTITRSIDRELSPPREMRENVELAGDLSSVTVSHDKINKWVKAYENINDTSNLCNAMFSIQLTVMILIVTVYYILLMYSITIISVEGSQTMTLSMFAHFFSMVIFLIALFMISRAGQKVQNSSLQLRQKLCELCVSTLDNIV